MRLLSNPNESDTSVILQSFELVIKLKNVFAKTLPLFAQFTKLMQSFYFEIESKLIRNVELASKELKVCKKSKKAQIYHY